MDNSSPTIYQGYSFYLFTRRNGGKWRSNLDRPFIVHASDGVLNGQFITSMWFKTLVTRGECFDIVVIRGLRPWPRRTDAKREFRAQVVKQLERSELTGEDPDNMVMWKTYGQTELEEIFNEMDEKLRQTNGSRHTSRHYKSRCGRSNLIMCFDACAPKRDKDTEGEEESSNSYFMSCPSFTIDDH